MRTFETGATRDSDDNKLDYEGFLSPFALERYARYMHAHRKQADGKLRDSDNWQKGIPINAYMKSLLRHAMEVWTMYRWPGKLPFGPAEQARLEDAICGVIFNAMGYLHELALRDFRLAAARVGGAETPASTEPETACGHQDWTEYVCKHGVWCLPCWWRHTAQAHPEIDPVSDPGRTGRNRCSGTLGMATIATGCGPVRFYCDHGRWCEACWERHRCGQGDVPAELRPGLHPKVRG